MSSWSNGIWGSSGGSGGGVPEAPIDGKVYGRKNASWTQLSTTPYPTVNTYADLPDPTTVPNEVYVVLIATGVWPFNRKPAGLYNSDGVAWTYMSAYPDFMIDANFGIQNSVDQSKILKFSSANIGSGQTRTLTMANRDIDLNNPLVNSIQLDGTPVVPSAVRSLYWDDVNKTAALKLSTDVTLQIGQEMNKYCYNATGSTILNGQAVYQNGVFSNYPTIALAKADADATSNVLGLATQDIPPSTYGYVTYMGDVRDIDTSLYSPATLLYLSATVAGGLTSTPPDKAIAIGVVEISNATTGSITVSISQGQSLSSLTDTNIVTPVVGQSLIWNGTDWINAPTATASAGPGVSLYADDTNVLPITTNNTHEVNTLTNYPVTTAEVIDTWNCTNNTVFGEAYLDGVLGRTLIDAGTWTYNTWCGVSSTAGGRISSLTINTYTVITPTETLTTTGTGTSRTVTSTGTPFIAGGANANMTLSSYIQTPQGLYQVTAYTSPSVVTIAVPSTYANETSVSYSIWRRLFGMNTGAITFVAPNYGLVTTSVAQPSFTINATDKIGTAIFATSNNTTSVSYIHNGNSRYSYFSTPLVTSHQQLALLQGGNSTERYHLTAAEATVATQTANGSRNGILSSADWTTFNGKLSDAPSDGNQYARQNAAWSIVSASPPYVISEDFIGATSTNGIYLPYFTPNPLAAGGSPTYLTSGAVTADHPGVVELKSTSAANTGVGIGTAQSLIVDCVKKYTCIFMPRSNATTYTRLGLLATSIDVGDTREVCWKANGSTPLNIHPHIQGDSNFWDGSNYTMTVNTWYRFEIVQTTINTFVFNIYSASGTLLDTQTRTPTYDWTLPVSAAINQQFTGTAVTSLGYVDYMAVEFRALVR